MNSRTEGAWIIHHTNKLQQVSNVGEFDEIEMAGKCGLILSGLAASHQESTLSEDKTKAIAQSVGVKKTELPTILSKLQEEKLINIGQSGDIAVLGVTSSSVLTHTNSIFINSDPSNYQIAAIELAEKISETPYPQKSLKEYLSDTHKLSNSDANDLFTQAEEIGFVDFEQIDDVQGKIYFNGNLFRRNDLSKTNTILNSLKKEELNKLIELDEMIRKNGCITLDKAIKIAGIELMQKMQSIGMYDCNEVSNDFENKFFITKPAAFSKFGNPFEEDALDLAKAFVASLTYGMNFSTNSRGKITMLKALMKKLINGYPVGPATAIGQDYRILELKRVVEIKHDKNNMYYMWLLKRDIGEIAMQVLEYGDATEQSILNLTSSSVINYKGPEVNRRITRKKQTTQTKKEVLELLRTFRA